MNDSKADSEASYEWLTKPFVLKLHERGVERFGGSWGVRDHGRLESALARPQNRARYQADVDVHELAAVYGHLLVRNHPFVDGNKRIGTLDWSWLGKPIVKRIHERVVQASGGRLGVRDERLLESALARPKQKAY